MKSKIKTAALLIASMCLAARYLPLSATAAQNVEERNITEAYTAKHFSILISAGEAKSLKNKLSLASGEKVTIQAYYAPEDAEVEFGLIYPKGVFHYIKESDGNADVQIIVDTPDDYQFAIRNNSSQTITVSGKIKY